MSEQKPENEPAAIRKLIAICIICLGLVYGIVALVKFLIT